jgi:PAS domain S-box-containing protein
MVRSVISPESLFKLVQAGIDSSLSLWPGSVLFLLAGLGVLGSVLGLVLSPRHHKKKAALLKAARAFTVGDLAHRLPPPGRGKRRELARTLNQLAARLKENALSRGEWEKIFDIIPDQIMVLDMEQRVTRLNRAAAEYLGLSPEEALGRPCYELINGRTAAPPACPFTQAVKEGVQKQYEFYSEARGRHFLATVDILGNEAGEIVGAVHVARDITAFKEMQRELVETSSFLNQVIESAPLAITVANREGRFTRVNPQFTAEYGYAAEEILGRHFSELYASEAEMGQLLAELRQRGEVLGRQVRFRHREGREVPTRISIRKLYGAGGELLGSVGLGRNISEEVSLRRQLEQAQKLEAIASLAGGLAHNFNNLLMVITGLTSLMLARLEPGHHLYGDLVEIDNQVRIGRELTQRLLTFARGARSEIQPLDLNELVAATAGMFARTRPDLAIVHELSRDLPAVAADPGQLQQVLMNLLINAWQAMPQGGQITLSTRPVTLEDWQDPAWELKPGPYVELSVRDTGSGMDEETLERLFEPFFTTKAPGQGTGLGLASAYRIVKGHGGAIQVQSQKGQGSTFTLLLPVSAAPLQAPTFPEGRLILGQGTILTVEDDAVLRQVATRLLQKLGYRVLEAPNGQRALEIFQERQGEIDLVLLDLVMPGLSGFQTLKRLRALQPRVRVLLCSGHGEAPGDHLPPDVGFLPKPYSLEFLSQKVAEVLQGQRLGPGPAA